MKLGRAVILSAGVAIVVGVGLFYGSRFTHRRVPTEKAGIVKIGLDPNRIIAVEKVEPSAEPEIGDDVKSPPKNDQVTFKLPKSVIEDMGLGARLVDVQDASIAGVLINSKGGFINWSCTGVTNFRSELPVLGKTGWKITVNQAGTTKTPSVWHSKPQIDVTNID